MFWNYYSCAQHNRTDYCELNKQPNNGFTGLTSYRNNTPPQLTTTPDQSLSQPARRPTTVGHTQASD